MSRRARLLLLLRALLLALLAAVALWAAATAGLPAGRRLVAFLPALAALLLAGLLELRGAARSLAAWLWSGPVFGLFALGVVATTLHEGIEPQLLALLLLGAVIATARSVVGGTFASALAAGGLVYLVSQQPATSVNALHTTHTLALLLLAAGLFTGFLSQIGDQEREEHEVRTAALRQELADLGEHLRNVLSCVASGVLVVDARGRVTTYNRAAERILGVPEHLVLGRELGAIEALARVAPLLERGGRALEPLDGPGRADLAFTHPALGERRIGYARTPLEDLAGQRLGAILVFQDVTLLRDYEARLLRQEQLAALGRMVSGIAHEFGNILGGAKGLVDLLVAEPGEAPQETLGLVGETLERALGTVDHLLRFARGTPLAPQPGVDPTAVLDRALSLARPRLDEHGVELERRLGPAPSLRADPAQLEQVVINLIINAAHAVADAPRRVIRASIAATPGEVVLTIEDSGPGVPPEIRDRIFEPFFTTKGSLGGSRTPGTGLGLSVAHGVIEGHGGALEVGSSPDLGGASFTIRLPSTAGDGPAEP